MGRSNTTHEVSICVLGVPKVVLLVIGRHWIVIVNRLFLFHQLFACVQPPILVHDDVICLILSLIYLLIFFLDELADWLRGRDIRFAMLEFRKYYFQMVILV